jgi:hypothetical protein
LEGIAEKKLKAFYLFLPPNWHISQGDRKCMNLYFINPIPIV